MPRIGLIIVRFLVHFFFQRWTANLRLGTHSPTSHWRWRERGTLLEGERWRKRSGEKLAVGWKRKLLRALYNSLEVNRKRLWSRRPGQVIPIRVLISLKCRTPVCPWCQLPLKLLNSSAMITPAVHLQDCRVSSIHCLHEEDLFLDWLRTHWLIRSQTHCRGHFARTWRNVRARRLFTTQSSGEMGKLLYSFSYHSAVILSKTG